MLVLIAGRPQSRDRFTNRKQRRTPSSIRHRRRNQSRRPFQSRGVIDHMKQVKAIIREYTESDREQLCNCFAELQDYERQFEPNRRPGVELADKYVSGLLKHCNKTNGKILVAIVSNQVVGFSCVFAEEVLDEVLNEPNCKVAYLSDLYVKQELRGSGLGKQLMVETESYARKCGATSIMLNVLADNQSSRQFYARLGYADYELKLTKSLLIEPC